MKTPKSDVSRCQVLKGRYKWLKLVLIAAIGLIALSLIVNVGIRLPLNLSKTPDAILVLGGSIQREIYAATLAKEYPNLPIIISTGSKDPCIWFIFQRDKARLSNVWLEKCAKSTFDNFFYTVPILRSWGVHKVKVITSPTHIPRAKWLAYIHLGSQGIATEMVVVKERGIPGNHENKKKTFLDVTRSLLWAIASQFIHPSCSSITSLAKVDLKAWNQQKFDCESQGKIKTLIKKYFNHPF